MPPSEAIPTDHDLVRKAQDGCMQSFEELVKRHQVRLLHYLANLSRSIADAEDIAQESFIRAYKNLHRFSFEWQFSTWLFTIARRLHLNYRRSEATRTAATAKAADHQRPAQLDGDMLNVLCCQEAQHNVWTLARQILDPEPFEALWLYYVEDKSVEEVAQVLGRTRMSVKTILFRGRKKLREPLGGTLEDLKGDVHAAGALLPLLAGLR